MPVVSIPVQQADSIISPSLIPLGQARFLLTLAAALVGPIALLALAVSCRRKYKTSNRPVFATVGAVTDTGERPYLTKQSRELKTEAIIMSVNRKPEVPPFVALDEESRGSRRGLSRSPSNKQKRRDGHESRKSDTDNSWDRKARSPPPVPFTPPALSTTFVPLQDRRLSMAVSTNGDFDPTLIHHGDWDINSAESATTIIPNLKASSPIPLRRSYSKILAADLPPPDFSAEAEMEDTSPAFAPSSFPSSNPILPIAPHAALDDGEMDAAGEVLSVMDDSGAGWKRHTRVYGGGVCLACMASGGGHHGGFYGENVPLDQRRY